MTRIYTGTGSGHAPQRVLKRVRALGRRMAELGWVLRSGGHPGVDSAFEEGACSADGLCEIYVPWKGYGNRELGLLGNASELEAASLIARRYSVRWAGLTGGQKMMQSRMVMELLGMTLQKPSEVLICWTQDGCEGTKEAGQGTGEARLAIAVAEAHGIPVVNVERREAMDRLAKMVREREDVGCNGTQQDKGKPRVRRTG